MGHLGKSVRASEPQETRPSAMVLRYGRIQSQNRLWARTLSTGGMRICTWCASSFCSQSLTSLDTNIPGDSALCLGPAFFRALSKLCASDDTQVESTADETGRHYADPLEKEQSLRRPSLCCRPLLRSTTDISPIDADR